MEFSRAQSEIENSNEPMMYIPIEKPVEGVLNTEIQEVSQVKEAQIETQTETQDEALDIELLSAILFNKYPKENIRNLEFSSLLEDLKKLNQNGSH
ncbi:MAG: hypothetical protein H0X62_06210 [Bacteroidetes bacterium]|nr:hypothetical protein [Bacteroidota bacterium]